MRIINCELCGKQVESKAHNRKYCDECRKIVKKSACNNTYHKNKTLKIEDLNIIFNDIINSNNYKINQLTTRGFEDTTSINSIAVSKLYKRDWLKVLDIFNKKEELIMYVANEYNDYYLKSYSCSMEGFYNEHKYITQHLIALIGINKIKNMCGFRSSNHQHTIEGLESNFRTIKNTINKAPSIEEFNMHTKVNLSIYYKYYNTSSYKDILRNMDYTEDEIDKCFEDVLKLSGQRYSQFLIDNNIQLGYTDKEKELEFKKVFDDFYERHGVYPTRRQFDRLSKYSDKAYTKTTKMTWNEVREFYGYPTTYDKNISETECLNLISDILFANYTPQKTWEWLKSNKQANLFVDGYYKEHNLCVEFDGVFHRKAIDHFGGIDKLEIQQQNDKLKDELVTKHGFKILRIDSRDKWYEEDYLIDKLQEIGIKIPKQQSA